MSSLQLNNTAMWKASTSSRLPVRYSEALDFRVASDPAEGAITLEEKLAGQKQMKALEAPAQRQTPLALRRPGRDRRSARVAYCGDRRQVAPAHLPGEIVYRMVEVGMILTAKVLTAF